MKTYIIFDQLNYSTYRYDINKIFDGPFFLRFIITIAMLAYSRIIYTYLRDTIATFLAAVMRSI